MIPPLRIALSGGGMKGIAHVGALRVLHNRGLLRCVKEYAGTSAGALIALCMVLGYTVDELYTLCRVFDFTLLLNLDPEIMLQCHETFGFDNGENLEKVLRVLLKIKGLPPTTTFAELFAKYPTRFRVFTTNIKLCSIQEFGTIATPGASVCMAVRASMTVPLYFTPVQDVSGEELLVDGGVIAHFPFHHLTPAEREETIGIAFVDKGRADRDVELPSIFSYILQLYYSVYYEQNSRLYDEWEHRIIKVSCGEFPAFQFDASPEQKEELMKKGEAAAEEFLAIAHAKKPVKRRFSVA
jgi:NTE family protein